MTELFNIHFFILQACCYQGNNLRSKQKNQDKRSCFKGSKVHVYIRLPCIAVKCLIFVQAGHYLLKHLMSQVFITIIVIINLLINLCMNYLMVCRRQISTCVKYYIQTVQLYVYMYGSMKLLTGPMAIFACIVYLSLCSVDMFMYMQA